MWEELTETHRELYKDPTIDGKTPGMIFDSYLKETKAENVFLLVDNGLTIRLTGIQINGDEGTLEPLFIKKEYRNIGLSELLINHVIKIAKSKNLKFLSAKPVSRNSIAIKTFYKKGFDKIGQIELFMDLKPEMGRKWIKGPEISDIEFLH